MSTRSSLAYGEKFHLYLDLMDSQEDPKVYLCLEGTELTFSASPNSVTVAIPPDIWATIRQVQGVDFTMADKTDEDLLAYVELDVDKRLEEYGKGKEFYALYGLALYGEIETPREQQVQAGLAHFQKMRKMQVEIREKMKEHKVVENN